MISRRSITLAILVLLPLLIYLALGAYALWQTGLFAWTFWILPAFWLITWLVAVFWPVQKPTIETDLPEPPHFTPRDAQALTIVRSYQERVNVLTPQQLTNPEFYLHQALQLSREISLHYHPKATDPVDSLTVPEVLAAARLAIDDMERWMLSSVPGSKMVTIKQWKWLQHAPKWIKRAQDVTWLASIFVNPANVLKYMTSEITLKPVTDGLQSEVLAAIYLRFIRQTGFYLVEMNSGRLRGGADLYRQTFGSPDHQVPSIDPELRSMLKSESVTVAVIGQVKAGKSSLINTLIGQRVAKSDVLPETRAVARYQMGIPESDVTLTLLDTPGYAESGATAEQIREVRQATRDADILLLVMAANSPARAADQTMLDELQKWRLAHPELRPAPIVICLTHIDLLSPVMEWSPPYDWRKPASKKAQSIADAVEYVRSLFANLADDVIPVCTDVQRGRSSQVIEELLPVVVSLLPEGKMAALLRAYHEYLGTSRFRTILQQLKSSGKMLIQTWLDERLSRVFSGPQGDKEKQKQSDK